VSNLTPNLGSVVTNATIRKAIYSTYVVALVIAGGLQVAFANPELGGQPVWLTVALSVLAYLGIPVGGLALANTGTPPLVVNTIDAAVGQRALEIIASNPVVTDAAEAAVAKAVNQNRGI